MTRAFWTPGKTFCCKNQNVWGDFSKGGIVGYVPWIYSKRYTYVSNWGDWFGGFTGFISHWLLGETLPETCTPPYPLRASSWLWWYGSAIFQQRRGLARSEVPWDFIWKGRWVGSHQTSRKKSNVETRWLIRHMPFVFCCKACGSFSCISCILIPCWQTP